MILKPPPDRLYGRSKGKQLRPRQKQLLDQLLPQLTWPQNPFGICPRETWLEVGFGGGEHAYALALANPSARMHNGSIEVFVGHTAVPALPSCIFSADDLPADKAHFADLNKAYFN